MIDIGVNLTDRAFRDDLDAVLARAWAAGVQGMVLIGTDVRHSNAAAALCARVPQRMWATAGIHPHRAGACNERALQQLADLAGYVCVVAIGECGLDFYRDLAPRPMQRRCFEAQLELAAELRLPVFLHQREAYAPFGEILRRHRAGLAGGVAHCFTGDREQLAALLDLDLYIGVTGWVCDERRGQALRESVVAIPPQRLLLETDAPYLLPRDLASRPRSGRNEPAYLPHICVVVARLRGERPEALAASTAANARRLFGLGAGAQ